MLLNVWCSKHSLIWSLVNLPKEETQVAKKKTKLSWLVRFALGVQIARIAFLFVKLARKRQATAPPAGNASDEQRKTTLIRWTKHLFMDGNSLEKIMLALSIVDRRLMEIEDGVSRLNPQYREYANLLIQTLTEKDAAQT